MGIVTADISVTLDGYGAGPRQRLDAPFGDLDETVLHRWMFEHRDENADEVAAITDAGAFLMGRNISGGRVYTFNWPGLAMENLQDRQDLKVTLDHRDILAEIVKNRLGNQNLDVVFPGYVPTMRGVTK